MISRKVPKMNIFFAQDDGFFLRFSEKTGMTLTLTGVLFSLVVVVVFGGAVIYIHFFHCETLKFGENHVMRVPSTIRKIR